MFSLRHGLTACFLLVIFTTRAVAQEPIQFARMPDISPDGKLVAFSYLGDIWIVEAIGGIARHVTMHEKHDVYPVFSPDGRQLAFSSNRHGSYDAFVVPIQGGRPTRLTHDSADDYVNSWTPDGKRILFSSSRSTDFPFGYGLYTVPVTGGRADRILLWPLGGVAFAGVHMPGLTLLTQYLDGPGQGRAVSTYTSSYALGSSGSFLLVGVTGGNQPPHRVVDFSRRVQGRLEEIDVERHAKRLEVAVLLSPQLFHGEATHRIQIASLAIVGMLGDVALRDLADVLALVALLGDLSGEATRLANSRLHAARQIQDLTAAVVVVELAAHLPAGPLEQRRDGVAERGLAAVADVQRARGVRGHELDVDLLMPADVAFPVVRPGGDDRRQHAHDLRFGQKEVDEPRSGDLNVADEPRGQFEAGDEPLGDGARLLTECFRERERQIGSEIAVARIARTLQHDISRGRAESRGRLRQRRPDRLVSRHLSELESFLGFGLDSAGFSVFSVFSAFSPARL